jgi:hypothetical protein
MRKVPLFESWDVRGQLSMDNDCPRTISRLSTKFGIRGQLWNFMDNFLKKNKFQNFMDNFKFSRTILIFRRQFYHRQLSTKVPSPHFFAFYYRYFVSKKQKNKIQQYIFFELGKIAGSIWYLVLPSKKKLKY